MKVSILLSLILASQISFASNLKCIVSVSVDGSNSQETALAFSKAKLSTKASSSIGDITGSFTVKVGKEKVKYSCVGTKNVQAINMNCTRLTKEEITDEDLLIIKLNKKSATEWLGTAYANDGNSDTFENLSCK